MTFPNPYPTQEEFVLPFPLNQSTTPPEQPMTAAQAHLPFARSIQERFEDFDSAHPEVYAYLISLCGQLASRGRRHYGIRMMWERMRWHFQIEQNMNEDFKLNDHYHSRYVRKIVTEHPEFAEMFELRSLRA